MRIVNYIGDIFEHEPPHWGLRGDAYLWSELQKYLSKTPMPNTAETLELEIHRAFQELTGQDLSSAEDFCVERYMHGGMSSGWISAEYWRHVALPLLIRRLVNV